MQANSLSSEYGPINCIYVLSNEVCRMLLVNDSQTNLHGNEYISLGSEMVPGCVSALAGKLRAGRSWVCSDYNLLHV